MAKVIPTSERIQKAYALIQKARELPAPGRLRLDGFYLRGQRKGYHAPGARPGEVRPIHAKCFPRDQTGSE